MESIKLPTTSTALNVSDVYTNLQGLQGLKHQENRDEALQKVSEQFESMFLSMVMKSMRSANAVFEKDSIFNDEKSQVYRDLLDQQRALDMAKGKGIGIADAMYRQLSRDYGSDAEQVDRSILNTMPLPVKYHAKTSVNNLSKDNSESVPIDKNAIANAQQSRFSKAENQVHNSRVSMADSPEEFVQKVMPFAQKAAAKLGVNANILIAQSALETGWGKHLLADENGNCSNNFFNIKNHPNSSHAQLKHSTLEYSNGVVTKETASFKVYGSIEESFNDYVNFISNGARYQPALAIKEDEQAYIKAIHKAGYASDPQYSDKVLSVYDRVASLSEQALSQVSPGEYRQL